MEVKIGSYKLRQINTTQDRSVSSFLIDKTSNLQWKSKQIHTSQYRSVSSFLVYKTPNLQWKSRQIHTSQDRSVSSYLICKTAYLQNLQWTSRQIHTSEHGSIKVTTREAIVSQEKSVIFVILSLSHFSGDPKLFTMCQSKK